MREYSFLWSLEKENFEMPIQKLYELTAVADTTGLKLGSVRQYVARGIIPAIYLGRKRVVTAEVLERICTEGLTTTISQQERRKQPPKK